MKFDGFYLHRSAKTLLWMTICSFFIVCTSSYAAQVTLAWDASTSDCDGYRIFMRTNGQDYDFSSPAWSGTATTCTINQLEDGIYYFVARAYKDANESLNSNEVEYEVVVNSTPHSDAGADQAVSEGTQVTLDGSGSADSDGTIDAYRWTQTSGTTAVKLSNPSGKKTVFTAPDVASISNLEFRLEVTDNGGLTDSDDCLVTILPVDSTPTDSDGDGLSDDDETNLYNTDPNNPDTDGDGVSDGDEVESGTDPLVNEPDSKDTTMVWIEAENADVYAPMEINNDDNASDGQYILVPSSQKKVKDPTANTAHLSVSIDIQTPGNYVVWGRILSEDNASDSYYVSVDDGEPLTWHMRHSEDGNWLWDPVSVRNVADTRNESNPLLYFLDKGVHTIKFYQRESGTKIDRLLITNDVSFIPISTGHPAQQTISFEAESGDLNAPMEFANDADASGGTFAWVPSNQKKVSSFSMDSGNAQYTFEVESAGEYIIWGRVSAQDGASDSFFISLDGGEALIWHTLQSSEGAWDWDVVSQRSASDERNSTNPRVYTLSPGTHTLTIGQRESGTKIDKLIITKDRDYIPE